MVKMLTLVQEVALWTQLREVCEKPLFAYWCTAHPSNLAFKSVKNKVAELNILFIDVQSVATFFHHSGVDSRELEEVAKNHFPDLKLLCFPQFKEVRFAEFTANLLKNHLFVIFLYVYLLERAITFQRSTY